MLRPRPVTPTARRGVILLVVIILLALFAVVGLTFVLYAESEAVASRNCREAEDQRRADLEPELLLSYFLSQFLYDVPNNRTGPGSVDSAMRGHSLARSMAGYNAAVANDNFYNGTGRLHFGNPDAYDVVNYQTAAGNHSPEMYNGKWAGGFNPSYTYPDLNNMYLGVQRPSDGAILTQSFYRPTWSGPLQAAAGGPQYKLLRPSTKDNPNFPPPEDNGGDVKNYMGGPGYFDGQKFYNNDSIWMDLGFPVKTAPDGKRYKPLFAPLVLDLDNRLNLLASGNIRGPGQSHVSNQGWGPWEINMGRVLPAKNANGTPEWTNLFLAAQVDPTLIGRYGAITLKNGKQRPEGKPTAGGTGQPPPKPRFYSQVDFDGFDEVANGPSGQITLPNGTTDPFPKFGGGYGNFSPAETASHPGMYNPNIPVSNDLSLGSASNMEALLRYGDTGSPALTSNLFKFLPNNLGDPAMGPRLQRMITTLSYDVDHPAPVPWVWDRSQDHLKMPANPPGNVAGIPADHPTGGAIAFPTTQGVAPGTAPPKPYGDIWQSEFGSDWRAWARKNGRKSRDLGRLDLNRGLPDYPAVDANGNFTDPTAAQAAVIARQLLAKDIFLRLQMMTNAAPILDDQGDPMPVNMQPKVDTPEYDACRWLAQLAVNIVDYVDDDEYSTPFNWNPSVSQTYQGDTTKQIEYGWVFGVELPRLVISEAYAEGAQAGGGGKAGEKEDVFFGVKLQNPMHNDTVRPDPGTVYLADAQQKKGKYRVLPCKQSAVTTMLKRVNSLGEPQPGQQMKPGDILQTAGGTDAILTFDNATNITVQPSNGQPNKGYYWACTSAGGKTAVPQGAGGANPDYNMDLTAQARAGQQLVVVLQRLACPGLPAQPDPQQPNFNPWLTIDYLTGVQVNQQGQNGKSTARTQPYVASGAQQQAPAFVSDNTVAQKCNWLVHLDRQLVSVPEVFQVSAVPPHLLTHVFMNGGSPTAHQAKWFDDSTRLYRAVEMFGTHRVGNGYVASPNSTQWVGATTARESFENPPGSGVYEVGVVGRAGTSHTGTPWTIQVGTRLLVGTGNNAELVEVLSTPTNTSFTAAFKRQPGYGTKIAVCTLGDRLVGRVNLNTLHPDTQGAAGPASTIFRALCDAQAPNYFTQDQVDQVFANLYKSRTQNAIGMPGPGDVPFKSLATGYTNAGDKQYPNGSGRKDTIFRDSPAGGLLFEVQGGNVPPHPYFQQSLLAKIWNNITIRSNVFAVWVTVGFFEVDASGKLGKEINRAEGRNIRHRMFAIVDRSVFAKSVTTPASTYHSITTPAPRPDFPGGSVVDVHVDSMTDIHQGCTVYFTHQARAESVTAAQVIQPDKVVVTGAQYQYNPGTTINFRVLVPQFREPGHIPILDDNGNPVTAWQTFSATLISPVVNGSGVLQLSDPSLLKYVQPGNTKVNVQGRTQWESSTVIEVKPNNQQPQYFTCSLTKVYNPGDTVRVDYSNPVSDPTPPGPNWTNALFFNTRDDHGQNNPIMFFSVIE